MVVTMTNVEILLAIWNLDDTLRCCMSDAMEAAEAEVEKGNGRYDDYSEQDDGTKIGIVYAENAAPEIDMAIHFVGEASAAFAESMTEDELNDARTALRNRSDTTQENDNGE